MAAKFPLRHLSTYPSAIKAPGSESAERIANVSRVGFSRACYLRERLSGEYYAPKILRRQRTTMLRTDAIMPHFIPMCLLVLSKRMERSWIVAHRSSGNGHRNRTSLPLVVAGRMEADWKRG